MRTGLMVAFGLGLALVGCKKMDKALLDEARSAVQAPCECLKLPADQYKTCAPAAEARSKAALQALADKHYFTDFFGSEELKVIEAARQECSDLAGQAYRDSVRAKKP